MGIWRTGPEIGERLVLRLVARRALF